MVEMFGGAWRRWDGPYQLRLDDGLVIWSIGYLICSGMGEEARGYPVEWRCLSAWEGGIGGFMPRSKYSHDFSMNGVHWTGPDLIGWK